MRITEANHAHHRSKSYVSSGNAPAAELTSCLNDEREFRFVEVSTVQGAFSWAGVSLHNDCYTNGKYGQFHC